MEKEGQYSLSIDGEAVTLQLSEVEITSEDIPGWTVANKGPLTVALDITLTPELENEGNAREFVNRIQKIRKESGFDLTDRIVVKVAASNGLKNSLAQFNDYICAEILADALELVPEIEDGTEIEINDISLKVIVLKKRVIVCQLRSLPAQKGGNRPSKNLPMRQARLSRQKQ
jgi:isoleucyl-tRNA synthetase